MSDLYKEIAENQDQKVDEFDDAYQTQTLLVFSVGHKSYAVESASVREIVRNTEVFPVPFVPNYVKGVLNYYSKPFAVVDFSMFLGEARQESKMFMVLNDESSVALQITDIQEFKGTNETVMQTFSEKTSEYFKGAIQTDDSTAPILNIENILKKVGSDIEKN